MSDTNPTPVTINPAVPYYVGLVGGISGVIAAAAALLTPLFGDGETQKIVAASGLTALVLSFIHTYLSGKSSASLGPLVKMIVLAILAAFLVTSAHAQPNRLPPPRPMAATPCVDILQLIPPGCSAPASSSSQLSLWSKIVALSSPDLMYAKALADTVNTPAARNRSACLQAIIDLNAQSTGAGLKDANGNPLVMPPVPHVLTDFEQLAQIVEAIAPTGPLFQGCAAAAQSVGMNVLVFVQAIIGGATGLAVLGIP